MKRHNDGLTPIGELRLVKHLAKEHTRAKDKLAKDAAAIMLDPDAAEPAFMARQLVQCTLPQRNPGNVPLWTRRNGNMMLGIQPGYDLTTGECIGYPYGTLPRLLLFWITTEAVRNKTRRLELGHSLNDFLRELGLDPATGGGKRGDAKRLKEQMSRLFASRISFQQTIEEPHRHGKRWLDMQVAPQGEFWWDPKQPEQGALWGSWIELGETFYSAITMIPVPFDMRALRALKRSPLALDLYAWICYSAFIIVQKNQPPQFMAWQQLMQQLGSDYDDVKDFKKEVQPALRKVQVVYPGLTIGKAHGGFTIHATRLACPQRQLA